MCASWKTSCGGWPHFIREDVITARDRRRTRADRSGPGGIAHHGPATLAARSRASCPALRKLSDGLPPPGLYHRIFGKSRSADPAALSATRGNQIRAAELLGLNRNTLRKKIHDLDIQVYRTGSYGRRLR